MNTIKKVQKNIIENKITLQSLVEQKLKFIAEHSGTINCFREIHKKSSIEQANIIDKKIEDGKTIPPLAGSLFSIKDTIAMKSKTITAGSRILEGYKSPFNASVINKIEKAGGIIVATANCDEFAMGSSGETCAWGPCMNPLDKSRVPGGSSSGSAASVCANFVNASLGTDTGGSIRQPSSFCGVVGFKPTYGLVSRNGLIGFAPSFDQIGPIANSVEDIQIIFSVIKGYDKLDSTTIPDEINDNTNQIDKSKPIIFPKEWADCDNDYVNESITKSINLFKEHGYKVNIESIPFLKEAIDAYYILGTAEASSNLSRFDGIRYGKQIKESSLDNTYLKTRSNGFGDEVKRRIMLGTYVLSSGYYDSYYNQAMRVRRLIKESLCNVLKRSLAIIGPTTPEPAFKFESKKEPLSMYLTDLFTVPANLAGLPAISIPIKRFQIPELPVGLQIIGSPKNDLSLLNLANDLELLLKN